MSWFNYFGLTIVVIVLLPNVIFAFKRKDGFSNSYHNKAAEALEQTGRYGCMCFMIFNIPYTYFNFWFDYALTVYLSVNGCLCLTYLICWIVFGNKQGKTKALLLSIVPSAIFVFSSIMLLNIPLMVCALLFAVNHILISYKNTCSISN